MPKPSSRKSFWSFSTDGAALANEVMDEARIKAMAVDDIERSAVIGWFIDGVITPGMGGLFQEILLFITCFLDGGIFYP